MTIGKTITLTIQTFVSKVIPLLFNTLFRFVLAFLPRRKIPNWHFLLPVSSWWHKFPKLAATSVCVPRVSSSCLLCLQEALQVGPTQALFRLLLLPWISNQVAFCVGFLRVKSLCWESYQQPQICRCYYSKGRKWKGTKEPLNEDERREWKSWLKIQHSEN